MDALLGWAALDGRGAAFVEATQSTVARSAASELDPLLEKNLGAPSLLIRKAWEKDRRLRLLGFAVLCEALANSGEGSVRTWLRQKLKIEIDPDPAIDSVALTKTLAALVRPALAWLGRHDKKRVLQAVQAAESLLDDPEVNSHVIHSSRLPRAWDST